MARSPQDDPRYNDNTWNFATEAAKQCPPGVINDRNQAPLTTNGVPLNENNMYANANFGNDLFVNKVPFNVQPRETVPNNDEKMSFVPPVNRQNYGNAGMLLHLSNGQSMRVFYDENNQQFILPMSSQYELFSHNQGPLDLPLQTPRDTHNNMFPMNQDYAANKNNHMPTSVPIQNSFAHDKNQTSNTLPAEFLKVLRDNWEPNSTGTYSPFGQNHPLNHPDAPNLNLPTNPLMDNKTPTSKIDNSPKRNETGPLADNNTKKRIVAEVKPMRPSYSDVLVKNTKTSTQAEATRKTKPQNVENKSSNAKNNSKHDKPLTNIKHGDENKIKHEKKQHSTISSGSESGDMNTDDADKPQKPKKSKNKRSNITRKWSSLDDITNEEDASYEHNNESQFIFIESQEKLSKKDKKCDKKSKTDKNVTDNDFKLEENEQSHFIFQENQADTAKAKKKKDSRNYHKAAKPAQDKKKVNQTKMRRNKPGYLGMAQNYLENWGGATWKALVWFAYLLSDICGMSLHLSFDLCTSVFTQTYVSSQAVWRSTKDWIFKLKDNKYLVYIDRKFGHTRFAFWRKLKWFKKEAEIDTGNDSTNLNANIPLPATGEEAMKRLLACKGKDPYSILGVSVTCTDEEIKRYYRRQAFLVHPDKNQQPGAEEAFKILQHAFDLIGEPERREAYSRRAMESRHAEAAWSELSTLLAQLHDKMEFAANTIRCTNCGRRHKRVLTDRPCYAARYCAQCKIRHSAKEVTIITRGRLMFN
ncbi:unnamed protein product [Diatraea saccharalis]|uniref:J domain-containing protein n=1 Tax=Diatraea saccharalis TaxID=40085 RepID=A0A9N9WAY1_9NEOP|nr:unnamed protein product [Diatraea saccharalis]